MGVGVGAGGEDDTPMCFTFFYLFPNLLLFPWSRKVFGCILGAGDCFCEKKTPIVAYRIISSLSYAPYWVSVTVWKTTISLICKTFTGQGLSESMYHRHYKKMVL